MSKGRLAGKVAVVTGGSRGLGRGIAEGFGAEGARVVVNYLQDEKAAREVADIIEDWFSDGAADGFNIMPPLLPTMLDVFSAQVIPVLQRRGLFRTAYAGTTLREQYGLAWPQSTFADAPLEGASA